MKKTLLISLAAASLLSQVPAMADPVGVPVTVRCPIVHDLNNFGDSITGTGTEILGNHEGFNITFKSSSLVEPIKDINNYENRSAEYLSQTGTVICHYGIMEGNGLPGFDLSYVLTNGKGGVVQSADNIEVRFTLPVGAN